MTHRFRQHRKRECGLAAVFALPLRPDAGNLRRGRSESVAGAEDYKIAAALPRFHISLVAEQCAGVLNGYDADACFRSYRTLGRQPAAVWIYALHDVLPYLSVKLQISRYTCIRFNHVSHLVI